MAGFFRLLSKLRENNSGGNYQVSRYIEREDFFLEIRWTARRFPFLHFLKKTEIKIENDLRPPQAEFKGGKLS